MNTCKLCENRAVANDGLCSYHHKERKYEEWLDNTDPDNLGIVKWVRELMPEFAYSKTPKFHEELFLDLLRLYDPEYTNKYERLYEFISFRESAKSTAANTLFVSYIVANNGRKFKIKIDGRVREFPIDERTIVIISEIAQSAEDFTVRIRDAFSTNERLRYYYRMEIKNAIDSDTGQWTRTAFKINNCFIQAVGSGQQIRGKVKGASRPTLVIADDIYSENTIITEERRLRTKNWWNNAVMNSIDNLLGKAIVLGTILHDDTILVELEKNPQWKTKKIPVMGHVDKNGEVVLDKFHEFISKHITVDWDLGQCKLPFDDIQDNDKRARLQRDYFQKVQDSQDWELAWPERINLYLLAIKYRESVFNNATSGLYQEYFHITKSPQERRFKRDFFQRVPSYQLQWKNNYNWIKIPGEEVWNVCNIEFGVDLAGTGADDAVISVIATLHDLRIYIIHQAIGKWSIRDDMQGNTSADLRLNKVALDRSRIKRVGVVDEAFRLARRYHPSKIKVGVAGEEELIVQEMRRVFQENRDYTTQILKRPQTVREGKKEQRILNTMLPYYETRMVYHVQGLDKLEYQLEYLGKSKHDDCADSAEVAFFSVEFPSHLTLEMFTVNEDQRYTPLSEYDMKKDWQWL